MEEWRDIPGYEGYYQVSDHGQVRSLDRRCAHMFLKGKMLKPCHSTRTLKYPHVVLSKTGESRRTLCLHKLVALTFIGPRPEGEEVRHLDGDKHNPVLSNLEYGTKAKNHQDRASLGESRFSVRDIKQIRLLHRTGCTYTYIGKLFGVSYQSISNICRRKSYAHIQ